MKNTLPQSILKASKKRSRLCLIGLRPSLRPFLSCVFPLTLGMGVTACSHEYKERHERMMFFHPSRQLAPEPIYNRIRYVYPPQILPAREASSSEAPYVVSVVHLELRNATLEDASRTLAAANRYSSYCSSFIANQPITLDALGTVEELGEKIAKQENIKVVIDHQNKEIRFMPLEGSRLDDEAQSGMSETRG